MHYLFHLTIQKFSDDGHSLSRP